MQKLLLAYNDIEEEINDNEKNLEYTENETKSVTKIRNIPHIQGNFSTLIYLKVKASKKIKNLKEKIKEIFGSSENKIIFDEIPAENNHYHISLSSNFYLKYHEINNFIKTFKTEFNSRHKLKLIITNKIKYLLNEYRTRQFLTLEIIRNKTLRNLINKINNILREFKIDIIFKDFLAHISILWSRNFSESISEELLNQKLNSNNDDGIVKIVTVKEMFIKIGDNHNIVNFE